jgi:pilus assembly protein CpaC
MIMITSTHAAAIEKIKMDPTKAQKIILTAGKSTIIESQSNIRRIALAAPEYADVTVLSPRQLYFIGKIPGSTNATLWDSNGQMNAILDIEIVPDVTSLKEKIYEMMPDEKDIRVTASHDSLVLAGTVSNTANLSHVLALAQSYAPKEKDSKAGKVINLLEVGGVHQVMLEVRVSEMSRTIGRKLGVNFNAIGNKVFDIAEGATTFSFLSTLTNPAALSSTLNLKYIRGDVTWTTLIDAMKVNGLIKVLAEPTLITTSGRPANFLAGGEFPVPVPQGQNSNMITIEYKTFGVGLAFTPTVLSSNKISMEVKPEVSELNFSNAIAISGFVIPSITTRRVSTVVELADGQSFAIAGLLKDDIREVVSKFPVLGEIPILGALFRSTSFQKNETELVIIVTPHLVKPLDMAKQTLPTDQYVEPNDFEFYLLGSLEGRAEPTPRRSSGVLPLRPDQSGLEGDFGHIAPK